jgi:hypothetical protein
VLGGRRGICRGGCFWRDLVVEGKGLQMEREKAGMEMEGLEVEENEELAGKGRGVFCFFFFFFCGFNYFYWFYSGVIEVDICLSMPISPADVVDHSLMLPTPHARTLPPKTTQACSDLPSRRPLSLSSHVMITVLDIGTFLYRKSAFPMDQS